MPKQYWLTLVPCRKIPFVLLTNGGGVTEEQKAAQMSRKFGLDVSKKHNDWYKEY
jgi:ribonucleotide monophosphatase NagD (HAD superfamily)